MLGAPHPSDQFHRSQPVNEVPRALVVDDSGLQRRVLATTLRKWGFSVIEAATAEEALAQCEKRPPDFVLSDWMMPGMNGLEFCGAFRRFNHAAYSNFILLTSKTGKEDAAQGLEAGADDFVSKPVNLDELRARMAAGARILQMQRALEEKNQVISATLAELQHLFDSVDKDLRASKKLQQSLVPERSVPLDQGNLSLHLRSSGHVGGDLVGYFLSGDNHLGVYAIDVSGHGISSARMTARLAGYLSASAPDHNVALRLDGDGLYRIRPPLEIIEDINDLVLAEVETEHYFTMLLADIDLKSGQVVIGQAGHPKPLLQRKDGKVTAHGPGGFPVGLIRDATFTEFSCTLAPGDRLLICSDGISECPDASGAMLEDAGLVRIMEDLRDIKGVAFFETLMWRLSEFSGSDDFPDDISGVLFER